VTLHPEIGGRPHRLALLAGLLERAAARSCPTIVLADAGDEL
jgi:hypothetical protein